MARCRRSLGCSLLPPVNMGLITYCLELYSCVHILLRNFYDVFFQVSDHLLPSNQISPSTHLHTYAPPARKCMRSHTHAHTHTYTHTHTSHGHSQRVPRRTLDLVSHLSHLRRSWGCGIWGTLTVWGGLRKTSSPLSQARQGRSAG